MTRLTQCIRLNTETIRMVNQFEEQFKVQKESSVAPMVAVVAALFGLIAFSYYKFDLYNRFLGNNEVAASSLGYISFLNNEIKRKSSDSLDWSKMSMKERVSVGDRVLTGARSSANIKLKTGGDIVMGENTLIRFDGSENDAIPNLVEGNFKVNVKGAMKIVMNGEVTEITGTDSQVQVILSKTEAPKFRLIKGDAEIQASEKPKVSLKQNQVVGIRKGVIEPAVAPVALGNPSPATTPAQGPAATIQREVVLQAPNSHPRIDYNFKLYDFYSLNPDKSLVFRTEALTEVDVNQSLKLNVQSDGQPVDAYTLSHANDEAFTKPNLVGITQDTWNARRLPVGTSYWKVSKDQRLWSAAQTIEVKPYFTAPDMSVTTSAPLVYLKMNQAEAQLNINDQQDSYAYILETSTDPQFAKEATSIVWLKKKQHIAQFKNIGTYYYRVRKLNQNYGLSDYSNSTSVKVEEEKLSLAMRAKGKKPVVKKPVIEKLPEKQPEVAKTIPEKMLEKKLDDERKIASLDESTMKLDEKPLEEKANNALATQTMKIPDSLNKDYTESIVQVQVSSMTMFSSKQQENGSTIPSAFAVGVRGLYWVNDNGYEGNFKTKAMSISGSEAPMSAELRYHRRFLLNFNPFSPVKTNQISVFFGYEMYSNKSSVDYIASYNLSKLGFNILFPVSEKWDTGGEVLYGFGGEQSRKYEVSGNFNYYWAKQLAIGAGYRAHFYESQIIDSTGPVPYKEAYGELFSNLKWNY